MTLAKQQFAYLLLVLVTFLGACSAPDRDRHSGSNKGFSHNYQEIADYLGSLGRTVRPCNVGPRIPRCLPDDAVVDGRLVAFATIRKSGGPNAVSQAVMHYNSRGGQAKDMIVDARQINLTEQETRAAIEIALEIPGNIDAVTVISNDFMIRQSF